ncbi:MAG: DNA primase [Acholeplasmataceae bacterium]
MINAELIEKINQQTSIVDLVSEYVKLEKRGKNLFGLCPFHDDNDPSFSVSPEKNIAKCMSCGEGGRPITFYSKIKNISMQEAAAVLAEKAGIKIDLKPVKKDPNEKDYLLLEEATKFFQFNLLQTTQGKEALDYVTKRIEKEAHIKHFKIGYARKDYDSAYLMLKDKGYAVTDMIRLGLVKQNEQGDYYDLFRNRIIFPITNPDGKIIGFSGRAIDPKEKAKYINGPETKIFKKGKTLYHIHEASPTIRKEKNVILFEGFFDVISAYQAGVKNSVATMGTALTSDHAKLIKKYTDSVVVGFDGDSAGQQAALQSIPILEREGLKVAVLIIPEKMDPDEFINAYGEEKFESLLGEFTKDSYQFRYDYYKQNRRFDVAHDVQAFKEDVLKMIRYADPSIASLYRQKLSVDLKISVDLLPGIKHKQQFARKSDLPPKAKKEDKVVDQIEQAEWILFYGMIQSKAAFEKYNNILKDDDYHNHLTAFIRWKLGGYMSDRAKFDKESFMMLLDDSQKEHFEKAHDKNFYWPGHSSPDEKDLEQAISLVKIGPRLRRIDFLEQKAKNEGSLNKEEGEELIKLISLTKNPNLRREK